MNLNKYTRRSLLTRIGGTVAATALAPFVPVLEADAQLNGTPVRYMPWYTPVFPNRRMVASYMPNSQGSLTWRGAMTGLNDLSSKMTLIRGLGNKAGDESKANGVSGGHKCSGFTMLAGEPLRKNAGGTQLTSDGHSMGNHSTLDCWLGDKLYDAGVRTPLRTVLFGFQNRAHTSENIWKTCSVRNGQAQYRFQSPKAVFDKLIPFAGSGPTTPDGNQGKKSALNFSLDALNRLQNRLGADDRMRLDQHMQTIRELEEQIEIIDGGGGSCEIPNQFNNINNRHDAYTDAYIKLAAIAFKCDLTRVFGGMFQSHLWGNALNFLPEAGPVGDYHPVTHGDGPGSNAQKDAFINAVMRYRAGKFERLMREFDGVVEGNGKTLLENSIIHWYSDVSRDHNWWDCFNVIAGGGGYIRMGRCVVVGNGNHNPSNEAPVDKNNSYNNHPQTKLLASIATAMGFPMDGFGRYNKGQLPNSLLV